MTRTTFCLALLAAALTGAAHAASVADLGKTLTPVGAEKAGNADGSIPAWEGGLCKAPASYKPRDTKGGGAPWADPFANEKPTLVISADNMAQYADKLDEGVKTLLKRYPATFKMNVYPTHRTACYHDWVYKNTIDGAGKAKLEAGGLGVSGAHAQIPFPVPSNGYEAMWNFLLKYQPVSMWQDIQSILVDSAGKAIDLGLQEVVNYTPYWDKDGKPLSDSEPFWSLIATVQRPASQAGVKQMRLAFARPDQRSPMAYSYIPGQRRVRLAPEFTYDTVSTTSGGILLFDEINGFDGKMDKFDFKLVGKKEMYMLYNDYKTISAPMSAFTKNHVDPNHQHWELHRVWEVEATLKPGQRHVEKKKVFFLDEDSWLVLTYYGIDAAGAPYHYMALPFWQEYEKPMPRTGNYILYDLSRNIYSSGAQPASAGQYGDRIIEEYFADMFVPDALAGAGIR